LTTDEALKIFADKYNSKTNENKTSPVGQEELQIEEKKSSSGIPDCSICLSSLLDLNAILTSEKLTDLEEGRNNPNLGQLPNCGHIFHVKCI